MMVIAPPVSEGSFASMVPVTCLYTVPTLTPKRRATSLTRTSGVFEQQHGSAACRGR